MRCKHEEERSSLGCRLALADAKAHQLTQVQADLTAAHEECIALKVKLATH